MKDYKYIIITILIIFLYSCNQDFSVDVPSFENSLISNTTQINDFVRNEINGIYQLSSDNKMFGDTVVVKWSGKYLSVFTGKNTAYMILQGGGLDSSLIFEGFWRFGRGDETGLIRLQIDYFEGASDLLNDLHPKIIILRGFYTTDNVSMKKTLVLEYSHPLKENNGFYIIAHKGGGRNADRLPHSENSIEIIEYAERLGANAIEIDVRLTKDNIPILYHDATFNTRIIDGEYMIGSVSNYYLYQIKNFCTLKHGEKIPTLEEALHTVLENTNLEFVWLDMKSASAVDESITLAQEFMQKAKDRGRKLLILIGIPTTDVLAKFELYPSYQNVPSICELDINEAIRLKSEFWASRWTMGLQNTNVELMHSEGRKALVWTIDDHTFVRTFINEGNFDGMVTNFSSIVAYEYYVKK